MSVFPENIDPRTCELIAADCNGTITQQEMQELEALLDADPVAQEFYVDFLTVNAEVLWLMSARQRGTKISDLLGTPSAETEIAEQAPIPTFLADWASFFRQNAPMSFVLIFLLLGLTILAPMYFLNVRRAGEAGKSEVAAVITEMRDCQWPAETQGPEEGGQLKVGQKLQLEKGLLQIAYSNRAAVLLEGPVCYTVATAKSGFLSRGKLVARAESPESRQFTIVTPNARFVDMGTEFGVSVEANGRAAVAVFTGEVKAEAKRADGGWAAPISLSEGQAGAYEDAKFTRQICKRSDFPSLRRLPLPPSVPYARWMEASRQWRSRRDLAAYYDFEPEGDSPSVLLNRAASGAKLNGDIQNAKWVQGRFKGKSALEFKARDAGVRVDLDQKLEQITLVAWVNFGVLANNLNGLLLSNDWSRPGQLHWEINSEKRIDLAVFMFNSPNNTVIFQSKAVPDQCNNQWCMISSVVDRMTRRCLMYVNDQCILMQSYDKEKTVIEADKVGYRKLTKQADESQIPAIEIGSATIAGWLDPGNDPSPNKIRSFDCRMDEMMIFAGALSAEEISGIYEAGKPPSGER